MNTEPRRRLFLVRCEIELVCWADSEDDAMLDAAGYAKDEVDNTSLSPMDVSEITRLKDVPGEWRKAVPYGERPEDDENPWEEYCGEAAQRIEAELKVEKLAAEHEAAQVALPLETSQ